LTIVFDTYIQRCHSYNEGVILNEDAGMARRFMETLSLPRHVGVVRLSASYFGTLDILVDTTSTLSNLHFVGIIRRGKSEEFTEAVGNHLANECQAPLFV
jgi:hypothetical protein